MVAQQAVIGVPRISIRNDHICRQHLPIGQPHTGGATVGQQNLIHLGIQAQCSALVGNHPCHRQSNRRHPAHGIVNPEFLFEV